MDEEGNEGLGRCLECEFFFFQAEDGIRDIGVTGVQTCALPIFEGLHAMGFHFSQIYK